MRPEKELLRPTITIKNNNGNESVMILIMAIMMIFRSVSAY